jgi:flotillin
MKSVPPLHELFDQAGLALPEYLAKKKESSQPTDIESESSEDIQE